MRADRAESRGNMKMTGDGKGDMKSNLVRLTGEVCGLYRWLLP